MVVPRLDRRDAVAKGWPMLVAARGARVAIDHIGSANPADFNDAERVALIVALIDADHAGHADRILLSASATGVAFGVPGNDLPYRQVLTHFVLQLRAAGVSQAQIEQMLITNTAQLLSIGGEQA
jgi:phosphotriesterase-related protein